jgi:mRNA interferase RelE/StbE
VSDSPWAVSFERRAERDVERLDKKLRQRVLDAVERLAQDPDTSTELRKLKGRAEHRLRVGEWRVLLALDRKARSIVVVRVRPRGKAYKR